MTTRWRAVVPLKAAALRKSRLAARLTADERLALTEAMAAHVLACLAAVPAVGRTLLLSPAPHPGLAADWLADGGRGLNAELDAVRSADPAPLLVIHADLPLLAPDDIDALLDAAERSGAAMAGDRHGRGTNAIALMPGVAPRFAFAFGPDSLARHRAMLGQGAASVLRDGLATDIDTPEDMQRAGLAG